MEKEHGVATRTHTHTLLCDVALCKRLIGRLMGKQGRGAGRLMSAG